MTTVDAADAAHGEGEDHGHNDHGHHEHGEFIAHHFTGPRQQYDSAKLGIWLFLVTEILFFSGLFVAYTIYRYHHPEVFNLASEFLDTTLGAINTVVLLFSSLTMAWAVRAAQLEQRRLSAILVTITIFCAAMFLGVKAVEYSHKWHIGLFVAHFFAYDPGHHGGANYLLWLSIVPAVSAVVCFLLAGLGLGTGKPMSGQFWGLMGLGLIGFFGGTGLGVFYQENFAPADPGTSAPVVVSHSEGGEAEDVHAGAETTAQEAGEAEAAHAVESEGHDDSDAHHEDHAHAGGDHGGDDHGGHDVVINQEEVDAINATSNLGVFFSIYYFMTGLHAFHIIAGILALGWLLYRIVHLNFRADYYGPVDYVGLYWHLVDLIWIYLFPLLYLIG